MTIMLFLRKTNEPEVIRNALFRPPTCKTKCRHVDNDPGDGPVGNGEAWTTDDPDDLDITISTIYSD